LKIQGEWSNAAPNAGTGYPKAQAKTAAWTDTEETRENKPKSAGNLRRFSYDHLNFSGLPPSQFPSNPHVSGA